MNENLHTPGFIIAVNKLKVRETYHQYISLMECMFVSFLNKLLKSKKLIMNNNLDEWNLAYPCSLLLPWINFKSKKLIMNENLHFLTVLLLPSTNFSKVKLIMNKTHTLTVLLLPSNFKVKKLIINIFLSWNACSLSFLNKLLKK
jgi:hypothetical protein